MSFDYVIAGGGPSACVAATRLVPDHGARVLLLERDPLAVLDTRLRVRGIDALRVIDCSAMPLIPFGNTEAPALVMGDRAASLIMGETQAASARA